MRCQCCGAAMVGQTLKGSFYYYRCRRAFAGPCSDRCRTRYVRAPVIESAVVEKIVEVLSRPDIVLAELRRAACGETRSEESAHARARIEALDERRSRLHRLFELGEIDEAHLKQRLDGVRAYIARIEGADPIAVAASATPTVPDDPEALAEVCAAVREWVQKEAEAGRLEPIAEALQIRVAAERQDDGIVGELTGVIPEEYSPLHEHRHGRSAITNLTCRTCRSAGRSPLGTSLDWNQRSSTHFQAVAGLIRTVLLIAAASLAALALTACERLLPDVEDWIGDSETLARRFDARLGDLKECVEQDNCDEALDTERGAFAMCSWVTSGGKLAPEEFEAAEWQRFDALCEGLEGLLELPKADAIRRIEDLQAETDRISEGIRADIEPRERGEVE